MKIAVLSGKGGTGKTFVSVNLAEVISDCTYVDCDVEEPNGHLFFQPVWLDTKEVSRKLPVVDKDKCSGCRICVDFCKFNALAYIGKQVLVFDEVCHSCGGCEIVCPEDAISEIDLVIGKIQKGKSLKTGVHTGTMNVNVASGVPIINQLLDGLLEQKNYMIDCPPGSACTVMESVKDADYCLLVAEPTIFGQHNLEMVHELVQLFDKPYGVVLNKCDHLENPSKEYCLNKGLNILGEIPYDGEMGKMLSEGRIPSREDFNYRKVFINIVNNIYIHQANNKFREV